MRGSRAVAITRWPRRANSAAVARPMPLDAPVISTDAMTTSRVRDLPSLTSKLSTPTLDRVGLICKPSCVHFGHGHSARPPRSLATALELVGDRWALLAVREVMFGNHRFSEIARNTAAPRDRLAARLKALVAAGILERRQYQASPPWHDYHLTAAGRELLPVMHALRAWGDKWAVGEPPLRAEHHGHPIHPYVACATCGEPVRPDDLELSPLCRAGTSPAPSAQYKRPATNPQPPPRTGTATWRALTDPGPV